MMSQMRASMIVIPRLNLLKPISFFTNLKKSNEIKLCHTVANTETFASLMRNCKLTAMGDPVGKTVIGKIYHVVGDDLYIDFGHKFGCVCTKPREGRGQYIRGAEVKLKVKSLELSQRFLGYDKDLSLLEADCILLGLHK